MLRVDGITVRFGDFVALNDVDLVVEPGSITAVLGPSGSGKSTLLRVIAGLQRPDAGTVSWDGQDLSGHAPHERRMGLVFQDHALFPHLDVGRNVGFGLRMQGVPAESRSEIVTDALASVELDGFERRRIDTLSGGQSQRVALARALAPDPRILLLDEPLGSLDRALRERLAAELAELLATLDRTAVFVTHDQEEAFAIADTVAVLRRGRIVQTGTPEQIYRTPADEWTARFVGHRTILDVTVAGGVADTPLGRIPVDGGDGTAKLLVRTDAIAVGSGMPARVTGVRYRGADYLVSVETAGLTFELTSITALAPGDEIEISVNPAQVVRL